MSRFTQTCEVEKLRAVSPGRAELGLRDGTFFCVLCVDDEVASAARLHDTIVVTIDVPDDQGDDDEPEDAPVYDLLPGGVLAPALPIPHFRLGEVS